MLLEHIAFVIDDTIQIASMVLKNRLAGVILAVNSPEPTKSLVERDVKQSSVRLGRDVKYVYRNDTRSNAVQLACKVTILWPDGGLNGYN